LSLSIIWKNDQYHGPTAGDRRQIDDCKSVAFYPNTDLDKATAEHCRILDAAVVDIDAALKVGEAD